MKRKLAILILVLIVPFTVFGQQICIDSTVTNNFYIPGSKIFVQKVLNTSDDGLLISGRTTQPSSTSDAVLIKLSPQGSVQWSRILKRKTAGRSLIVTAIASLQDSTFALGIIFNDKNNTKIGILKLDKSGNIIWEKTYRNNIGTRKDEPIFLITSINEGKDGDLILNTFEDDLISGLYGPGLTLLGKDGNVRWSIEYNRYKIQINAMNSNIYQNGKIIL